jgi:hypothetical protein
MEKYIIVGAVIFSVSGFIFSMKFNQSADGLSSFFISWFFILFVIGSILASGIFIVGILLDRDLFRYAIAGMLLVPLLTGVYFFGTLEFEKFKNGSHEKQTTATWSSVAKTQVFTSDNFPFTFEYASLLKSSKNNSEFSKATIIEETNQIILASSDIFRDVAKIEGRIISIDNVVNLESYISDITNAKCIVTSAENKIFSSLNPKIQVYRLTAVKKDLSNQECVEQVVLNEEGFKSTNYGTQLTTVTQDSFSSSDAVPMLENLDSAYFIIDPKNAKKIYAVVLSERQTLTGSVEDNDLQAQGSYWYDSFRFVE